MRCATATEEAREEAVEDPVPALVTGDVVALGPGTVEGEADPGPGTEVVVEGTAQGLAIADAHLHEDAGTHAPHHEAVPLPVTVLPHAIAPHPGTLAASPSRGLLQPQLSHPSKKKPKDHQGGDSTPPYARALPVPLLSDAAETVARVSVGRTGASRALSLLYGVYSSAGIPDLGVRQGRFPLTFVCLVELLLSIRPGRIFLPLCGVTMWQ